MLRVPVHNLPDLAVRPARHHRAALLIHHQPRVLARLHHVAQLVHARRVRQPPPVHAAVLARGEQQAVILGPHQAPHRPNVACAAKQHQHRQQHRWQQQQQQRCAPEPATHGRTSETGHRLQAVGGKHNDGDAKRTGKVLPPVRKPNLPAVLVHHLPEGHERGVLQVEQAHAVLEAHGHQQAGGVHRHAGGRSSKAARDGELGKQERAGRAGVTRAPGRLVRHARHHLAAPVHVVPHAHGAVGAARHRHRPQQARIHGCRGGAARRECDAQTHARRRAQAAAAARTGDLADGAGGRVRGHQRLERRLVLLQRVDMCAGVKVAARGARRRGSSAAGARAGRGGYWPAGR